MQSKRCFCKTYSCSIGCQSSRSAQAVPPQLIAPGPAASQSAIQAAASSGFDDTDDDEGKQAPIYHSKQLLTQIDNDEEDMEIDETDEEASGDEGISILGNPSEAKLLIQIGNNDYEDDEQPGSETDSGGEFIFNAWDPSAGLIIDHAPHNPDSESDKHMSDDAAGSQQSAAGSSALGDADGSEGNQKPAQLSNKLLTQTDNEEEDLSMEEDSEKDSEDGGNLVYGFPAKQILTWTGDNANAPDPEICRLGRNLFNAADRSSESDSEEY